MTKLIKHKISFASGKEQCAGYMYLPRRDKQFPCVIMANGFSGTMDWILPAFAERFFALAEKGQEVSAAFIRDKAAEAGLAEIREYPFGHFELYHGAAFETVVSNQVAFLQKHL
jgi:hypothetical protein